MRDQRSKKENSSMTKLIVLSDCLSSNHSFWIRIGQYLKSLGNEFNITVTDNKELIQQLREGYKLIFYRYSLGWGDISDELIRAKYKGVAIISDIDDYLWNDGEKRGWTKERLRLYTS